MTSNAQYTNPQFLFSKRLTAIDAMRGIVMVLMALDHASHAFNAGRFVRDSATCLQPEKSMTERECALTKDTEIIWDLSELRWVRCMPEDEVLETCIPITDMKRLPKISLKPLPPKGSKTIVLPQE